MGRCAPSSGVGLVIGEYPAPTPTVADKPTPSRSAVAFETSVVSPGGGTDRHDAAIQSAAPRAPLRKSDRRIGLKGVVYRAECWSRFNHFSSFSLSGREGCLVEMDI